MTRFEAAQERHSVRAMQAKPLSDEVVKALKERIAEINSTAGLNIQLVTNEPKAFRSPLARYGRFSNVTNYLVMAGKPSTTLDETIGYYGEDLVIMAQMMGVNSCWVGLTYKLQPDVVKLAEDDKVVCVIALGYGADQGKQHRNKELEQVCNINDNSPVWFLSAVSAALAAPTAVNQQKFYFELQEDEFTVKASAKWALNSYAKVDLGIAKYHFEIGLEEAGRIADTTYEIKWA